MNEGVHLWLGLVYKEAVTSLRSRCIYPVTVQRNRFSGVIDVTTNSSCTKGVKLTTTGHRIGFIPTGVTGCKSSCF